MFFRPFALTVTFALLASLLVSLTVVPVGVSWLLSKKVVGHRDADETTLLQRLYLPALKLAISHRLITIVLAVAVFVGAMALTPLLETNLVDSSGTQSFSLTQQLPPGTELSVTSDAATKVEAVLAETPGVETYQVTIGSTGDLFGPGGGTNASCGTGGLHGPRRQHRRPAAGDGRCAQGRGRAARAPATSRSA